MTRGCAWALALGLVVACGDEPGPGDDTGAATGGIDSGSAGDDGGDGSEANAFPTLELSADPSTACGADGTLVLRATQTGCVNPPPAPCTVPEPPHQYQSEAVTCPSSESALPMRVEIELPGRFEVRLIGIAADGSESPSCISDTGDPEVIVANDQFDTNPTIPVGPC